MGPGDLKKILDALSEVSSEEILVGIETKDDAAVTRLESGMLLVQTVDFFTPIVDNPYTFGQISAANALSDIYAMGARPLTALNIVAYPCSLGMETLSLILAGGHDKLKESGTILVGGHSIDDREPKYGLAVSGLASPDELTPNSTAKPGDKLILTKPLGTGVAGTALKAGLVDEHDLLEIIESMTRLNLNAATAAKKAGVKCCTDITGFGLLGHLFEISTSSDVTTRIDHSIVPFWPQSMRFAEEGLVPAGTRNNQSFLSENVIYEVEVKDEVKDLLSDPQTSGGLLLTVSPGRSDDLKALLEDGGDIAAEIGEVTEGPAEIRVY